jgi:NADH dehydrogenase
VVKSAPGGEYELGGPEVLSLKELTARILDVVQRRRLIAPVPFFAAKLAAWPMALLPNPPVTPDQIELMKADSVVSEGAKGLSDLGIRPESLGNILPTYLWRFRKTGQFEPALH